MKCPVCDSNVTYQSSAIWYVCKTCKKNGKLGEWVYEKTEEHTYVMVDITELAAKDALLEAMEKKLSIAEGALMRIKTKAMEFEDRVNDTPPQSVPWWSLGDIAAAALKRLEGVK